MSCLFNSLSFFLGKDSYSIRQEICDYLQSNNKIIDGLDTLFILELDGNNYIENMRNTNTWGGANEIQVACNIWNMRVVVRNHRDALRSNIEFLPLNGTWEKEIELEWTGGHYEPVRK